MDADDLDIPRGPFRYVQLLKNSSIILLSANTKGSKLFDKVAIFRFGSSGLNTIYDAVLVATPVFPRTSYWRVCCALRWGVTVGGGLKDLKGFFTTSIRYCKRGKMVCHDAQLGWFRSATDRSP